jgi:hypothetical protein
LLRYPLNGRYSAASFINEKMRVKYRWDDTDSL